MSNLEKEIRKRANKLKYPTDRLGVGSLFTQANKINAPRLIMENNHMSHMVNIANPEVAKTTSGFEKILSSFTGMVKVAQYKQKILEKIVRNEYNYILVTYSEETKIFNVIERKEVEEHSEEYCTMYNNSYLDSLEVGDYIEEEDTVSKSTSMDKHGNYMFGKNFNTLFMISVNTIEDGITFMNGAEKMMDTYKVKTLYIPINENEIPLNLMGGKNSYKAFPDIGEKIKSGMLMGIRSVNPNKALYSMKDSVLRRPESGDRIYYTPHGKVIDIKIYCNKDIDKISKSETFNQIKEYYTDQLKYYQKVYSALSNIINNSSNSNYSYSDELTYYYDEALSHLDVGVSFTDVNEALFSNMIMVVKVLSRHELTNGSKNVGRGGNKGTVCKILPPEESYFTESGKPIHMIVDALGIVSRLNPGVLYEHTLNAEAEVAVSKIKKADSLSDKFEILFKFLSIVNEEQANAIIKYTNRLNKDEKKTFITKIEKKGIFIVQDPVENCDLKDLDKLYKEFPPVYERVVFPDGGKSLRKVVVAPLYIMRLKQDPIDKFSARGRGMINPLTQLPTKSNLKKLGLELFSDIAVRIGSSESDVLLLCNREDAVADFMAENSTSKSAKEEMSMLYTDSLDGEFDYEIKGPKKNKEIIDANLLVLSSELKVIYDED